MSEFHDLAEVALNSEGKAWGNLGYWKDHTDYSDACEALAILFGDNLGLSKKSSVIDIGFGCGDQLLLWRQRYDIADISGINYSQSQTELARKKLAEAGYPKDSANLRYGDASDPKIWKFNSENALANTIIALDCAYHFPDRSSFFQGAIEKLAANGRIGLTDFVIPTGADVGMLDRWVLKTMLKLSRIPTRNIVSEQYYAREMQRTGFDKITITDISEDVMPGFAKWWWNFRHSQAAKSLSILSRLKYEGTARFLNWAYRKNILKYCLITATKTRTAD